MPWHPIRMTLLVLVAAATLFASESDDALEDALGMLDRLDAERLTVEERGVAVRDVIRIVASHTSIPIRGDWHALERLGIQPDDRVDLECERTSALTALRGLTLQLGDEFERPVWASYGNAIHLTTRVATEGMSYTDAYDVRDLIAAGMAPEIDDEEMVDVYESSGGTLAGSDDDPYHHPRVHDDDDEGGDEALNEQEGKGGDVGDDDHDEDEGKTTGTRLPALPGPDTTFDPVPDSRFYTPGEALLRMIADHVDPEGWRSWGGSRGTISDSGGVLLVTAPATTHRQFRSALSELRRANVTSVSLDVVVIDVPRASLDRLRRRHDLGSASLVQALRGDGDTKTLWQALSAGSLDDTVELSAAGGNLDATLVIIPHFNKDRAVLELEIAAKIIAGADRSEVKTTVTAPFRFGGVTLELPAAGPSDSARLLLILPRRAG